MTTWMSHGVVTTSVTVPMRPGYSGDASASLLSSLSDSLIPSAQFMRTRSVSIVPAEGRGTLQGLLVELRSAMLAEKYEGQQLGPRKQSPTSNARLSARVIAALQAYTANNARDWRLYSFFNDQHYVRNLVYADDDFELMVVCWQPGQVSRVHNHASSHGWVAPLHRSVREERFEVPHQMTSGSSSAASGYGTMRPPTAPVAPPNIPGVLSVEAPCPPLVHMAGANIQVGEVVYINDSIAIHSIGNPSPAGAGAGGARSSSGATATSSGTSGSASGGDVHMGNTGPSTSSSAMMHAAAAGAGPGVTLPASASGSPFAIDNTALAAAAANAAVAAAAAFGAGGLSTAPSAPLPLRDVSMGPPSGGGLRGGLDDGGAVTLHVYCPPIRRVRLYEESEGRVVERVPGFYSIGGVRRPLS